MTAGAGADNYFGTPVTLAIINKVKSAHARMRNLQTPGTRPRHIQSNQQYT